MGPLGIILIIICLVLIFGGLPQFSGHSYGAWPSGLGGLLLIVLLILLLTGRL